MGSNAQNISGHEDALASLKEVNSNMTKIVDTVQEKIQRQSKAWMSEMQGEEFEISKDDTESSMDLVTRSE